MAAKRLVIDHNLVFHIQLIHATMGVSSSCVVVVFFPFFPVTAEHLFRLMDEAFCSRDAAAKGRFAFLNFTSLLSATVSPVFYCSAWGLICECATNFATLTFIRSKCPLSAQ